MLGGSQYWGSGVGWWQWQYAVARKVAMAVHGGTQGGNGGTRWHAQHPATQYTPSHTHTPTLTSVYTPLTPTPTLLCKFHAHPSRPYPLRRKLR